MFDGIDVITLPVRELAPLERLYVAGLGFRLVEQADRVDPAWQAVWSLPAAPTRLRLLGKPGSQGGWIRLVEVPDLPPAVPAGRPDHEGPYALDFYLRGADDVEERLAGLGWTFRSEPQHYPLPGTNTMVRERMLLQPLSGLVHALVEHRPGQTRCVLAEAAEEDSSEVVAVVFFTCELAAATRFAQDVLGARPYFTGRFDGAAVERMLGLAPDEGFEAALFRGPRSRNARLEFAAVLPAADSSAARACDRAPRVVAGCAVDDLAILGERLADGVHGTATTVTAPDDGSRRIALVSRYGATFEFWQREG